MTSTTAVSCLVAISSSESLPNDGKSPISQKRLSFPKYGYGKISVNRAASASFSLALSESNIHKSITGRMVVLVDSVSISLYNQAVEMIYSLPRSGCDAGQT